MKDIELAIDTAYDVSNSTTEVSKDARFTIISASDDVKSLNINVNNMQSTINTSIERFEELIAQINEVTSALGNIKNIATQTNLLEYLFFQTLNPNSNYLHHNTTILYI